MDNTIRNSGQMYAQLITDSSFIDYTYLKGLENRKIYLNEEITDDIVEKVIIQILNWNEEDESINIENRKPITIYVNSPGGNVDIGLVLCDVIKRSKTPIYAIGLGIVASMGALIYLSCHYRSAYPSTNILLHSGSMQISGTTTQVEDTMAFQKEKEQQIKELILSSTKITEEKYKEMYRYEWWMTAKTAQEYGLVDKIL